MKYLLGLSVLVSCSFPLPAHAQSTVVYQNSTWAVVHSARQVGSSHCFIASGASKAQAGGVFLIVFPNDKLLFTGDKIANYFEQASKVTIQTGDTKGIEIPYNATFSGIVIVNDLLSGDHENVTVTIDFAGRDSDVHTFPIEGFQHAYTRHLQCNVTAKEGKPGKVQTVDMGE